MSAFDHIRIGLQAKPSDALVVYYSFDKSDEDYEPGIRQRFRATQTDIFQTTINTPHTANAKIDNHALTLDYPVFVAADSTAQQGGGCLS